MLATEQKHMTALPKVRFDSATVTDVKVYPNLLVRHDESYYSAPARLAGRMVTLKAYPPAIELWYKGEKVATHRRSYQQSHVEYQIAHYLPILEKKTRAVRDAAPVKRGVLEQIQKYGERLPDKEFVAVLRLAVDYGQSAVIKAIETALCHVQYAYETVRFNLLQELNPTALTKITISVNPSLPTVKAVDLSQYSARGSND